MALLTLMRPCCNKRITHTHNAIKMSMHFPYTAHSRVKQMETHNCQLDQLVQKVWFLRLRYIVAYVTSLDTSNCLSTPYTHHAMLVDSIPRTYTHNRMPNYDLTKPAANQVSQIYADIWPRSLRHIRQVHFPSTSTHLMYTREMTRYPVCRY